MPTETLPGDPGGGTHSDESRVVLVFTYEGTPSLSGDFKGDMRRVTEVSLQVLRFVSIQMREKGWQISEPTISRKGLGLTRATCMHEDCEVGIAAECRLDGHQWWIWAHLFLGHPRREPTSDELKGLEGARDAVEEAVGKMEGSGNLRWLSGEEVDRARRGFGATLNKPSAG